MTRIRVHISTGFAGCDYVDEYGYDDTEWEAMTEEQQKKILDRMVQEELNNHIEAWAEVIGPCKGGS